MTHNNRELYNHWLPIKIRWGDMDALGHVNNVQYFRYSECARIDYIGCVFGAVSSPKTTGPILADIGCSFYEQVSYPDDLDLGTRAERIGNTSMHLTTAMFRKGTDQLVAQVRAVVVWFDYPKQASGRVPDAVRERIREYERVAPEESV